MKLINKQRYTIITTIIVFFLTANFFNITNNKILPKLENIAYLQVEENIALIKQNIINDGLLSKININDIIIINKNQKEEITHINFNLENSYEMLGNLLVNIQKQIDEYKHQNNNAYYVKVPYGSISNNVFLSNLGTNIIIKIEYYGNVIGTIKTKVSAYGINNSLIDVYLHLVINEQAIIPFQTKKYQNEFDLLIGSSIIEGIVPSYYNGTIEKESSIITIPLNK